MAVNYQRLVLCCLLAMLAVVVVLAALKSPWFDISRVVVEGARTVSEAEIRKSIRVPPHSNLFRFQTDGIVSALKRNPAIQSVTVVKRIPRTLCVRITERRADHIFLSGGVNYKVDRSSVPFCVVSQPVSKLPVLSCELRQEVVLGKPLTAAGYRAARKCLNLARSKKNFSVARISVDQNGDLCLNTTDGLEARLGQPTRLDDKLGSVEQVIKQIVQAGCELEYVDLSCYPDGSVIKQKAQP